MPRVILWSGLGFAVWAGLSAWGMTVGGFGHISIVPASMPFHPLGFVYWPVMSAHCGSEESNSRRIGLRMALLQPLLALLWTLSVAERKEFDALRRPSSFVTGLGPYFLALIFLALVSRRAAPGAPPGEA